MDRERFSDVSEDNHHPLVTSSEPENGKDPPRVKREMPQEREINLAQQQQQQYEGTQPMYPSSCPPRRYGVGAKSGIVVPTKSNEERNLMEPSQSVKEETGVTMAGTESEDETVTGDDWMEEERRSTSLLRSLTEPNNQAGQGTGLGLTMLAPNISSHAPRVDTGWGLSPVIIVPIHDGTELTTGDQETEQLGDPVEEQLDRGLVELEDNIFAMDQFKDTVEEDLQNDSSLVELEDDKIMTPGTGRTWPPQRTMTHIPYFPYMVRSVVAPKESLSSKARQAQRKRKFYWRRKRRRRRAANKEESEDDIKRSLVEAKERVKFLESRQVCRDFTEGRCRRGQSCKFAHVLSTTMREDTVRQMAANTQPNQPTPSGFGAVGGQGLYQPSGEEGNCIHFERGYCKFGNTCEKTHDPTKYATRPRSGSHGSNQGFRGRSRPTVGTLGAIAETGSPQRLPEMNPTAMTREQMMEEVRRLDEMARGRHGISEEIMLNQIREMRNSNILSEMMTTEQVQKAFPSKRD